MIDNAVLKDMIITAVMSAAELLVMAVQGSESGEGYRRNSFCIKIII